MKILTTALKSSFPATTNREECGFLIGDGNSVTRIMKTPNRAADDEEYEICYCEFERAKQSLGPEEQIMGFIHTHLSHHDAQPSDVDFDGAELNPEMLNCVYKPDTGELVWYGLAEVGAK